jgi:hypothetical protein
MNRIAAPRAISTANAQHNRMATITGFHKRNVMLDLCLDEIEARPTEPVPQLAERDRHPNLFVDPDHHVTRQHGESGEQHEPADYPPDDHRGHPLPFLVVEVARYTACTTAAQQALIVTSNRNLDGGPVLCR